MSQHDYPSAPALPPAAFPVPGPGSEVGALPVGRVPIVGMRPRSFICSVCGLSVTEEVYGQGFKRCGHIQAGRQHMLCEGCLAKITELIGVLSVKPEIWECIKELVNAHR